jgi:hypothetical protein
MEQLNSSRNGVRIAGFDGGNRQLWRLGELAPFIRPYPVDVVGYFRFGRNMGRTYGGLLQTRYCLKPPEIF